MRFKEGLLESQSSSTDGALSIVAVFQVVRGDKSLYAYRRLLGFDLFKGSSAKYGKQRKMVSDKGMPKLCHLAKLVQRLRPTRAPRFDCLRMGE